MSDINNINTIKEIIRLFLSLNDEDRKIIKNWIDSYEKYEKLVNCFLQDEGYNFNFNIDWDKCKVYSDRCYENGVICIDK